ncbi:MAG: ShlB/FhaC/HecB family hemolysin secretion/activation protein [Pseudomonadota bacterium]|nr:ShlB/FhaC/HecB family hemolysin secretion/activation protein [Pseudomonadota bacterium]
MTYGVKTKRRILVGGIVSSAMALACHSPAMAQANNASSPPKRVAAAPRIAFNDILAIGSPRGAEQGAEADSQIGAVIVEGNEAIGQERYQQAIEPFFGEPLTDEVIERLTDELTQIAKDEGYAYARAEVDRDAAKLGILKIAIDEGRVDEVRIEGSDNALARKMLNKLVGRPINKAELERTLLLVSDIPAVRLRQAKLKREGDGAQKRGVLMITLQERDPSFRVAADNYGSENFGPIRANVLGRGSGILLSGDEISTSVRINPIEPDELLFVSGSYSTALNDSGATLRLSGSVGRTSPGDIPGGADITGDKIGATASVSVPIKRSRKASAWIEADASYISISQDDLGTLLRDDTIVTASVGLRTRFALAGGVARTGVSLQRGLDILGATRLGDPAASRFDGDGVFTKFRFNADFRVPLAKRLSLYVAAAGQLADRPLLGPEEISLGGAYRTRGYDFAEVLGDEGVYGIAEIRYNVPTGKLPLRYLQLYGFVDGGYVSDIDLTGGEGSLFSAGPGLRTRLGPLDLELEGGFPLGGSGERTEDADPQVNVRAGINF